MTNRPVWDDSPWAPPAPLVGDAGADVCVIGLGGSGLSAIDELRNMGRTVIGIDAADVAAGAAGRNGGLLLGGTADFHHDAIAALGHTRALRLHQLTMEEIRRIAMQAPGTVRFTGSLRLSASEDEDADIIRQRDAMRADGIRVEDHDSSLGHGIFMPDDASFNPLRRCRLLARSVMERGAVLHSRTRARAITGRRVETERGVIHCERVVVAVDGALERLFPELEGTVRTARLQMLGTAPIRETRFPCPVSTRYGFDYWQQNTDGSVALGGGRDREIETEWTHETVPTDGIQGYLTELLRARLGITAPITHRWAASVSYTTTGLPFFSEVRPKVHVVGAYSGTGNAMGALGGRAAARAACGETTEFATLLNAH